MAFKRDLLLMFILSITNEIHGRTVAAQAVAHLNDTYTPFYLFDGLACLCLSALFLLLSRNRVHFSFVFIHELFSIHLEKKRLMAAPSFISI